MQLEIQDLSPVEKKLIVQVPWDAVNAKLLVAYRDLAKEVSMRGFRRGKVPRSVLERMYGKRVRAEVASQFVRESFMNAATEHSLAVVSEPIVDEELVIKKGQPLQFEARVEVRGEVKAENYEGMDLERRKLDVADEAVQTALESLQKDNTELRPIEGRDVVAATDVVALKLVGTIGEHDVSRDQVAIDLENAESQMPGLVEALRGLPIDTTDHEIELTMPEDYSDETIAGKTASLTVSFMEARYREVPSLDDDFAKDLGRGETLDELRADIRKELEASQTEQITREVRDVALKELVNRNQIPVASSLVDRAAEMQFNRFKSMLGGQAGMEGFADDMRERMRPQAEEEVRGQLLLDAIATEHNIEVGEPEIDAHFAELAKSRGGQAARLRAEYDRDGRLDNIRFSLVQDKTLDFLIEKGNVTEVEASVLEERRKAALEAEREADKAEAAAGSEDGSDASDGSDADDAGDADADASDADASDE